MDTRSRWAGFLVLTAAVAWTSPVRAQAPADTTSPAVGAEAPDFSLPGATRFGLLKNPVRLSDYRGQTVVVAFFFKARTKG